MWTRANRNRAAWPLFVAPPPHQTCVYDSPESFAQVVHPAFFSLHTPIFSCTQPVERRAAAEREAWRTAAAAPPSAPAASGDVGVADHDDDDVGGADAAGGGAQSVATILPIS